MSSAVQINLKRRMDEAGLNAKALALKAGRNASAVYDILSGKSRNPRTDTLAAFARVLGCRVADLTGESAAGLAEDGFERQGPGNGIRAETLLAVLYPGHPRAYWVRMRDRAVELAGIAPGDFLIVDPELEPTAGDIVVAQAYDSERGAAQAVLREYRPPVLLARSADPEYQSYPIEAKGGAGEPAIGIVGVVTRTYSERRAPVPRHRTESE